jgi:hypothetical protein
MGNLRAMAVFVILLGWAVVSVQAGLLIGRWLHHHGHGDGPPSARA